MQISNIMIVNRIISFGTLLLVTICKQLIIEEINVGRHHKL